MQYFSLIGNLLSKNYTFYICFYCIYILKSGSSIPITK